VEFEGGNSVENIRLPGHVRTVMDWAVLWELLDEVKESCWKRWFDIERM
jgi:hypothetical protein